MSERNKLTGGQRAELREVLGLDDPALGIIEGMLNRPREFWGVANLESNEVYEILSDTREEAQVDLDCHFNRVVKITEVRDD